MRPHERGMWGSGGCLPSAAGDFSSQGNYTSQEERDIPHVPTSPPHRRGSRRGKALRVHTFRAPRKRGVLSGRFARGSRRPRPRPSVGEFEQVDRLTG